MTMLTSFDPFFHDFGRLSEGFFTTPRTTFGPRWMPVDAYKHGDAFIVKFDLPSVDPDTIDLSVEKNVLSVTAERNWAPEVTDEVIVLERPQGSYSRQLFLSDNLDTDHIEAHYDLGTLMVTIPVSEAAKPRKVAVTKGETPILVTSSN